MEAKTQGRHFTGLEIQEESADMAKRSVAINHLEDKIDIIIGDIKEASSIFGQASFDVVTSNPPYMNHAHGLINPEQAKAIARHELLCTFEDVAREAARVLKPNGRFYLVHRPFRLVEILNTLSSYKLEPKRIRFVHPYMNKEPNMILLECLKGGKSMVKVEAPLVVYKEPNVYTDEIHKIYGNQYNGL